MCSLFIFLFSFVFFFKQKTAYEMRISDWSSACALPISGQPDFAHLVIDYIPTKTIVESKSLKLFLNSFRNHGAFHEDCTVSIARRLVETLKPRWLRIGGYWYPRGGMPLDVFYQTGKPPAGLWLPDQGVASYLGRGCGDAAPRSFPAAA